MAQTKWRADRGTHTGDEDHAASATGNHDARRFTGGEEGAVNVDIEQPLYAVEWVVERGVVLHDA